VATFVLVHGAWGGGWEWRRVADLRRAGGHVAFAPTLTGLGERAHLAGPDVDLETHVADVVGVLTFEDLRDAVLVGHSSSGSVVTGAADRAPERLRRLVYVDAVVPAADQALVDMVPSDWVERNLLAPARDCGNGWLVPVAVDAELLGLPGDAGRRYVAKLVPHPLGAFMQPLRLGGAGEAVPRTFVHCVREDGDERAASGGDAVRPADIVRPFAQRAQERGWDYRRLTAAHDPQISDPDGLVAILEEVAALG